MIAEIGHYALIMSVFVVLIQATLPLWGAKQGNVGLMALAKPAAQLQFALVFGAFLALTHLFVTSDFSVAVVAQNSHSAKPMLYKVSGVWGNHEGSMLLWVLILAVFGAGVATFGRNLPASLRARVLAVQAMIALGFLVFIIATSNPFERIVPPPLDGRGLNPLLQDPGLAFHPPFLYLGYVGFSMAFSFAVAALIEGRVDAAWARWVRPWTLAAWCNLTLGIALGSWWAYYELGWGGWWFWDPVENASFMPWLAGTALLHSAIVVEKRDALKSWTILLAIITFSLSLIGTFLVRSGVLTSVHAFATDPTRGVFILLLLVIAIGGSLTLYALRGPVLKASGTFAPISREGGLVLNNFLLSIVTATVFIGTLYPLFIDAIGAPKLSVGEPYFNATFWPFMVPLLAAMPLGGILAWKRGDLLGALQRLWFAGAVALIVLLVVWYVKFGGPILAVFGMALAAWLFFGTLVELADLGDRGHSDHASGPDHRSRGLPVDLRGGRPVSGSELRQSAGDLRGHTRRQRGGATLPREENLSGVADADHRIGHLHHRVRRSLHRARRSSGRWRLGRTHLSQPNGSVALGRRNHHGHRRHNLADRPPLSSGRPDAPTRRQGPAYRLRTRRNLKLGTRC
jgi:cytochrome c-type biogenesis protein CcmF